MQVDWKTQSAAITESRLKRSQAVLQKLDTNKNGHIDANELQKLSEAVDQIDKEIKQAGDDAPHDLVQLSQQYEIRKSLLQLQEAIKAQKPDVNLVPDLQEIDGVATELMDQLIEDAKKTKDQTLTEGDVQQISKLLHLSPGLAKATLDIDGNGKITKDELKSGISKAVEQTSISEGTDSEDILKRILTGKVDLFA